MEKFLDFPNSPSSRLRAPTENIQTLETDVLIIGGGVAGCLAAIGVAEKGAKSVICEKGGIIERSGSIAGGVDHFFAILENGSEWGNTAQINKNDFKINKNDFKKIKIVPKIFRYNSKICLR